MRWPSLTRMNHCDAPQVIPESARARFLSLILDYINEHPDERPRLHRVSPGVWMVDDNGLRVPIRAALIFGFGWLDKED